MLTLIFLLGTLDLEERIETNSNPNIEISNVCGSVSIKGSDANQIFVGGYLTNNRNQLVITPGKTIKISVEKGLHPEVECAHLEISVPKEGKLNINVTSSDIGIQGYNGTVQAKSVSGNVSVAGNPNMVDITTVSGESEILGPCTHSILKTVSGDIELSGVRGILVTETVSSTINVSGGVFEQISINSVSGDISFEGTASKNIEGKLVSHSGDINLTMPNFNGTISASSFSGNVEGASDLTRNTEGSGLVRIETFSGDVKLGL